MLVRYIQMKPCNPYAPVKEENLFFGEKRIEELETMARQIHTNGYSYVVLAGDRMGKTSFLLRLLGILGKYESKKPKLVNIYMNLSHMMPLCPGIFLQGILDSIVNHLKDYEELKELKKEAYTLKKSTDIKTLFDDFIDKKLKNLMREGEDFFGKIRLVLLIDDAKHLVTGQDWSEAMYHQLRYLFVDSPLSNKISAVLTGFRKMRDLKEKVGSPFNHMQTKYLEGFSKNDCRQMLECAMKIHGKSSFAIKENLLEEIYELTGGHVFLLNVLYSSLRERLSHISTLKREEIWEEVHHILYNEFENWCKKLSEHDKKLYSLLNNNDIWVEREFIQENFRQEWKDSIEVMSSMGIIKKKRENKKTFYRSAGRLFREWFSNNLEVSQSPEPSNELQKNSGQKFYIYRKGIKKLEDGSAARKIIEDATEGRGDYSFVIDRVFNESLIWRDRKITVPLPGKIALDLLTHLAINRGIFQSFPRIGYALWEEEFTPKANIQNIKSILLKELKKKGIDINKMVLSRRGGYLFNEDIDVCIVTPAIIRCHKCGNPGNINLNSGRCTNSVCKTQLISE